MCVCVCVCVCVCGCVVCVCECVCAAWAEVHGCRGSVRCKQRLLHRRLLGLTLGEKLIIRPCTSDNLSLRLLRVRFAVDSPHAAPSCQ